MAGRTGNPVAAALRVSAGRSSSAAKQDGDCAPPTGLDSLLRTIEGEIIPRLVLAHRGHLEARELNAIDSVGGVAPEQVAELTQLVIRGDLDRIAGYVRALIRDGLALDAVYLDLIAPVARRLGEMWKADDCDFSTVTLGVWRLQQLLHDTSASFMGDAGGEVDPRRILLAAMPGEQHTFGVFIVGEYMRRASWDVLTSFPQRAADVVACAAGNWFDVIGISVGCEARFDALAALVRELRRASSNRSVGIMVGGPVFLDRPEAVVRVGADVSAPDARQAVHLAQDLIGSLRQRLRIASGR